MEKPKFRLHPLFILFLFVFVYNGMFDVLICYLVTIILHEYAHFLVSSKKGYHLNKFTLMPHGISLSGTNQLFSTKDEIQIALAGPIFNLCLAVFFVAVWWIFPSTYVFTQVFVIANFCTFLVNLLPIFPMDGGRVLLAFLSPKIGRLKAMSVLKICGLIISFLMIFGFVISTFFEVNFTFLILGIFCFMTCIWEDKQTIYSRSNFFEGKQNGLKRGLSIREIAVHEDITLYKLLSYTKPDTITNFRVLKNDFSLKGMIYETELEKLVQIYPASATLKTILS